MEPNGFVEEGADEDISSDGHESSDAADEESSPRLDHEVRGGAHRDAAAKDRHRAHLLCKGGRRLLERVLILLLLLL